MPRNSGCRNWPWATLALTVLLSSAMAWANEPFRQENLVAWCIVPFDAAKRGPEERAAMLERLGILQLAYDWRAEHVGSFEEEIEALARHRVRLTAWWIAPPDLSDVNRQILALVAKHGLHLQFWVLVGDPPRELSQAEKIDVAAAAIRPFAAEAGKIGCQVGLYNHGGWFGEAENQLAILDRLAMPQVGLVYNLHHGHTHLGRFAELLAKIKPHLLALNLNGMSPGGDAVGKKILPLGTGEKDLELLAIIRESGYAGPIGILNHTDLDAEARLADNIAGLRWLEAQLDGSPAPAPPKFRSFDGPVVPQHLPADLHHTAHTNDSTAAPGSENSTSASVKPSDVPSTNTPPDELSSDERNQLDALVDAALASGRAKRGAALFASPKFACLSCHRVGSQGGNVGPELTKIASERTAAELAESLLWPRRVVRPEFVAWNVITHDGQVLQAYVEDAADGRLALRDTATGTVATLASDQIDQRQPLGSLMPEGLAWAMSHTQRRDVLRFLSELKSGSAHEHDHWLAHAHRPEPFEFRFAPLVAAAWRHTGEPVNRERLYDFYAKEAEYFAKQPFTVGLLPEFPGLDGGVLGHWGNQNEDTWRDGRWNETELGSMQAGIVHVGDQTVARGVCVRLDGDEPWTLCYDPQAARVVAAWRGGMVKFSDVRHGFLDGLQPVGVRIELSRELTQGAAGLYRGFYRVGRQVIFAHERDGKRWLDSFSLVGGRLTRETAPEERHSAKKVLSGGAAQWPQVLETRGTLGSGGPWTIDTIGLPLDNPWKALLFIGDHDFLSDGSAMVATIQGDVWHVSGLDERLEHVRWKRFAAGLSQPLGLVVENDQVYVLGRDQITRLHDLNADDEADFYECFSTAYDSSPAGHDFVCGLARDGAGNFFLASGNQGLVRVSADGTRARVLATGFRNPDGLCLLPDGSLTVPASEGEWTATSMIYRIDPARGPVHCGYRGPVAGQPPEVPLVYLPRGLDNSAGAQCVVRGNRWGPLEGMLLHFSYGMGTHFLVLRDDVRGQQQGAVVPLPGDFSSGAHRGRFHPKDGQLYVSGMAGWGTYTSADGSLERVRYTGGRVQLPMGFHVHENGVAVRFAEPVDSTAAARADDQFAQVWNYRYAAAYGSPEFAPSHPGTPGHDRLEITSSHVLPDGRTVFFEIPDLQPVNQLHLRMRVGGEPQELYATVHALDAPFEEFPDYQPIQKTIAAHPLLAEMELLLRPPPPNPWREPIDGALERVIEAGKNLSYATRTFRVPAGAPVALRMRNPDVVPHNWVLVKPGALERVGELCNRLVADPAGAARQYVPESDDVICYTDVVLPAQEFIIYFHAPEQPGRYPFLCSFPGHWMAMNGQMQVEPAE